MNRPKLNSPTVDAMQSGDPNVQLSSNATIIALLNDVLAELQQINGKTK